MSTGYSSCPHACNRCSWHDPACQQDDAASPTTSPVLNPSLTPISVWGGREVLSHTSCGLSCFIAQIAFSLTTFGHRLSIHPSVINRIALLACRGCPASFFGGFSESPWKGGGAPQGPNGPWWPQRHQLAQLWPGLHVRSYA